MKVSSPGRILETVSKQKSSAGRELLGVCVKSICIRILQGRKTQMQSEYAQPFASVKVREGAGLFRLPWGCAEGPTWPGGQSLLCAFIKGPAWWPHGQRVTAPLMSQVSSTHCLIDVDELLRSPLTQCRLCLQSLLAAPLRMVPVIVHSLWFGFSWNLPMETSKIGWEGQRLIIGSQSPGVGDLCHFG